MCVVGRSLVTNHNTKSITCCSNASVQNKKQRLNSSWKMCLKLLEMLKFSCFIADNWLLLCHYLCIKLKPVEFSHYTKSLNYHSLLHGHKYLFCYYHFTKFSIYVSGNASNFNGKNLNLKYINIKIAFYKYKNINTLACHLKLFSKILPDVAKW